jgi:hypothetical protein
MISYPSCVPVNPHEIVPSDESFRHTWRTRGKADRIRHYVVYRCGLGLPIAWAVGPIDRRQEVERKAVIELDTYRRKGGSRKPQRVFRDSWESEFAPHFITSSNFVTGSM